MSAAHTQPQSTTRLGPPPGNGATDVAHEKEPSSSNSSTFAVSEWTQQDLERDVQVPPEDRQNPRWRGDCLGGCVFTAQVATPPPPPASITTTAQPANTNAVCGHDGSGSVAAVNDRLARTPELYLLALSQFAIAADTEVVHVFVLACSPPPTALSPRTLAPTPGPIAAISLQLPLLAGHDLRCRKAGDAAGRPWHALQAQTFTMTQQGAGRTGLRESAYGDGFPNLVMDLQTAAVLQVFRPSLSYDFT
ncbi:hypothetical protein DFP72DRAFT_844783 [Ephemerocybe angulata]|uniref:Uncharacterized protein n=1 Tax=Ephemerocybe angulata TaxID=980116 RepID=A0A8H6I500_9AGAR|nr:hypothetical protein DFP72DRAFT_844783 [Tulosesus angulatus]